MGKNTREKLQKGKYSSHGITLIALVITIIILIILAGVAINLTVGENGIFNKAKYAKEQYQMAVVKEEIQLAIVDIQSGKLGNNEECTIDTIISELPSKLEGLTISKDGDVAKGTYNGYDFIIDEDLNVTIEGYNPSEGEGSTEGGGETTYTVTFNGINVTSNGASAVKENETYTATLTAATGYEISTITVKMGETTLTKDTDYTYTDGVLSISNVNGSLEITATIKVAGTINGEYVNYGIDINGNGVTTDDWMIFYREEGDVNPTYTGATYIIPAYYVPYERMKTSVANAGMSFHSGTYRVRWSSVPILKTVTDDVKEIFMYDYTGTNSEQIKAASRLIDTTAWESDFITPELKVKGGMAIGGPTLNMWCASWNKKYPMEKVTATGDELDLTSYAGYKMDAPNEYFPTKDLDEDETRGYWITGLCNDCNTELVSFHCQGGLSGLAITLSNIGLRPLVYLPSTVTLEPSGVDNLWNINYNN